MEAIMNLIYSVLSWTFLGLLIIGTVSFLVSGFKSLGSDKFPTDHQTTTTHHSTHHSVHITFQKKK